MQGFLRVIGSNRASRLRFKLNATNILAVIAIVICRHAGDVAPGVVVVSRSAFV